MHVTGKSIHVLHVDDDPEFADMAATFVEAEDERFNVEIATSASEGLDRLAANEFDCVVSDYDMPRRNGIEFLEAVRENHSDLPFILYTGKGSEAVASDAISAGVTDYLQKETGTSQYTVLANRVRNCVEKYHAQAELTDREKRLNLFFEQSPLGVIEWNENFEFERMNDAAEEILGYADDELVDHSWEMIVPDSDRDGVADVVSDLLDNKGGYHSINENVRKDGERIICEWHNRVVTDADGTVVSIFSQFQDITERRRQERRFEAIFNNTHTFVGLLEPDGTLLEANDTALAFGGLDREEVVGKPLWETYWAQANDETRATIRNGVEEARSGTLFRDEIRVQGSDRDAIIDFSIRPVTDERGEVTLLIPEGRDITARKEKEREAQQRRHRLEQILKTVPACVVQIDADGQFAFANERAEEVLGLEPDAVTERTYNDPRWDITDLDGNPIPDKELPFRKVIDTGEPVFDKRHTIEWPDGSRKILSVQGAPLFDEKGEIQRTVFALMDVTEHEERQKKLRQTTARLEALYENSPDLIDVLDPDGRLVDVNKRFCEELGYAEDELIGTPIWKIDQHVTRDDVDAFLSDIEEGERRKFEGVYERRDGSTFPVEIHILRLSLETGDRFLAISRDITDRKEQERKRKQIIDRVTDAIVEVNADWKFTLANEQAEELYDMDEEYLLGRDFWDVFTEAQDTRFEEEYRRVMEQREPTSFVEYYSGLDGWFDIEAYPKSNGGIAFYFIEVTEQRERQLELERRDERFRYVEEVANIGYWEIDPTTSGPYDVTLSDGVYHVHDLSPDEPFDVEKGLQFYHPEDRPKVEHAVEQAISDGEPYDYEARLITAAGSERWVQSVGEPVERDGEVVKVRGVFQDITERKRKEQALARQNERLDDFVSVVSHDLRNPLQVAEGRLELAQDDCDSEHLDRATNAIERSQRLIDALLTLAREGEELGDVVLIDLRNVIEDCWANVETADATLSIDTNRTINADKNRLRQVLENLISNAVKHGGEEVTVVFGDTEDGFYVADDGPGIPEDQRDHVFDPGQSTISERTGLGLTIVEQVVNAHDWDIAIEESECGGTRFEITGVDTDK